MTKAEIVDAVYERVGGFSKKEAAEVVEAVFETMKTAIVDEADRLGHEELGDGEESRKVTAIKISGFGNFVVRAKPQRTGRNPQTGDPIPISARRVLTFKPSQVLKGALNPHKSASPRAARMASGGESDIDSAR
jgi:integration host factor subunit alpha